jgi:hypothetical protein
LALKTWAYQLENKTLPSVETFTHGRGYYENEDEMVEQLKGELQEGIKKAGRSPTVLVMGALVSFPRQTKLTIRVDVEEEQYHSSSKQDCQRQTSPNGISPKHQQKQDRTKKLQTPTFLSTA